MKLHFETAKTRMGGADAFMPAISSSWAALRDLILAGPCTMEVRCTAMVLYTLQGSCPCCTPGLPMAPVDAF